MRILLLGLLLLMPVLCASQPAYADRSMPVMYSRTNIVVMRAADEAKGAPPPLPWQENAQKPEEATGVIFDVEIRDAEAFYAQSGWYDLSAPSEKSGVMVMFQTPGIAPIAPSAQYAPLDILMIDKEGIITQIAPSITLSALEEDLMPESPVKAFLFLRGGTCEATGIQPGDRVLYKMFRQPPTVLSAPARTPSSAAPAMTPQLAQPVQVPPSQPTIIGGGQPMRKNDVQNGEPQRRATGPLMVPVQ